MKKPQSFGRAVPRRRPNLGKVGTLPVTRYLGGDGRQLSAEERTLARTAPPYHMKFRVLILALFAFFAANSAFSQIQQAWVRTYNNGLPNGNHQALKIALDTNGNIYITGFSQNTNNQLGYATIKYAPNGTRLWTARYDSTNFPSATPAALVLDTNANAIITGTAVTVKCDTNGDQLWTAPYAGTALALQSNVNPVVTGYGATFNTVKLSPTGSNVWTTTYTDVGPTVGQAVAVDTNGNIYVSGWDAYFANGEGFQDRQMMTIKCDPRGNQIWVTTDSGYSGDATVTVCGSAVDSMGDINVVYNSTVGNILGFVTGKYASDDGAFLDGRAAVVGVTYGLSLDTSDNIVESGQVYLGRYANSPTCGVMKLNTNDSLVWSNSYPQPLTVSGGAWMAIAVDSGNNVCVTGFTPGANSSNNIVTIKYDSNDNQIWLESYSGPNNGSAVANAIAVDANGNVYVAGYETVAGGGTEMVLIRYSPVPTVQRQPNGSVQLHATGNPGQTFDFQASTNFLSWLDLGTTNADTNGCVLFTDTNAPLFPYRFYLTTPE
jgi:hypothetical protein